jgi:uncharacterized repeat protein (TIGR01451 family)
MTPETQDQNKERILKLLAIGGLIGLVIIISWLGIQLIRVMPNAFTSLASLADSVYNYTPVELIVVSSTDVVNSGDSVTISWNDPTPEGEFSFTYDCAEGVAVAVRGQDGTIEEATCAVPVVLGDVTTAEISITAERNRFTDITYTISFITPRAIADVASASGVLSVVNVSIGGGEDTATTTTPTTSATTTAPTATTTIPVATTTAPVVSNTATTTKPKPVAPAPTKPAPAPKPVYTTPVSNPKGVTDLAVRSLGAGVIVNNQFVNVGTLTRGTQGAIQIEVRNLGTKTSANFTFTATLPNGATYVSKSQKGLKPNERAVITIGFFMNDDTGTQPFDVTLKIKNDSNTTNNSFTSAVRVK